MNNDLLLWLKPAALFLMVVAGLFDIQERRFPNSLFVLLFVTGLFTAYLSGHLVSSIIYFIIVSLFSVFVLFGHFGLKAGDLKFFSCLFLFFDPGNMAELKAFACVFVGGLTVFGLIHLLVDRGSMGALLKEIRLQIFELGQMITHPTRNTTYYPGRKTIPLVAELAVLYFIFYYWGWKFGY